MNYAETSAMLTEWKKTDDLSFLNDVSSVPLQQCLRHLQGAFANFFEKRAGYPRFKSRKGCAISDASWSEFRGMLGYKVHWYGREVIAVDQWFPSSKTCSACGKLAESMPLNVRSWTCAGCGASHDRDINAARNILAAGLAVAACGDGVRPARR